MSLSPEDKAALRAEIRALPPLTDAQLDAVCEVLDEIRRARRRRLADTTTTTTTTDGNPQ